MMRLAEDKKGLCGCTAPFCMAVSCVPAFIRSGVSVMRSCYFASSSGQAIGVAGDGRTGMVISAGWEKWIFRQMRRKRVHLFVNMEKKGYFCRVMKRTP